MNRVVITGTLKTACAGGREFFLQLRGAHSPLVCQLKDGVWDHTIPLGTRMTVTGQLASRDISKINPCNCKTVTDVIESYVKVDRIDVADISHNEVQVCGYITSQPQLVHTPAASFYSARIRLFDGLGYISVTMQENPGKMGDLLTVHGTLRVKDYKRHMDCPCCKNSWQLPILSVSVRGR